MTRCLLHPSLGAAFLLFGVVLLGACKKAPAEGPTDEPAVAVDDDALADADADADGEATTGPATPDVEDASAPVAPALTLADAQGLYEQCRERVEGPEQDGECTTDADCSKGGCSSEMCATAAALEGMMSTCEVMPCFSVLDTCGCNEGRCTWTVKTPAAGEGTPMFTLPPKTLPPKQTAPGEETAPAAE